MKLFCKILGRFFLALLLNAAVLCFGSPKGCDKRWCNFLCISLLCTGSVNVLGVVNSEGLHDPGPVRWPLALCLLAAWFIIFLCMLKGIRSSGKVNWHNIAVCSNDFHLETIVPLTVLCSNVCLRWFMWPPPSHTSSSLCWSSEGPRWRAHFRALPSTSHQTGAAWLTHRYFWWHTRGASFF